MKGDFTRDTFDATRHFSRVLMQQGRVQLDADFNEQIEILLYQMRMAMVDLIGPYGGPANPDGSANQAFKITANGSDIIIKPGRYYVQGLLCLNTLEATYKNYREVNKTYYAYLDLWERHITHVQDDRIREKALGGPDTCTRAQITWRTILKDLGELGSGFTATCAGAKKWVDSLPMLSSALIKARLRPEKGNDDACSLPPESRYRGVENQLYRIELHQSGVAWNGTVGSDGKPAGNIMQAATFKWSRDNGSIVFPIVHQQGNIVTVQSLGKDERTSLKIGDWIEIMDDDHELQGVPGILAQVDKVDLVEMTVTLKLPDDVPSSGYSWPAYDEKSINHPLLRRWDHQALEGLTLYQGAILITESGDPENGWIEIENGIEVQFQPPALTLPRLYRTADYWLIPARVATGKIEWPPKLDTEGLSIRDAQGHEIPEGIPPHGIRHRYAPLAVVMPGTQPPIDCRCTFHPLPCQGT